MFIASVNLYDASLRQDRNIVVADIALLRSAPLLKVARAINMLLLTEQKRCVRYVMTSGRCARGTVGGLR